MNPLPTWAAAAALFAITAPSFAQSAPPTAPGVQASADATLSDEQLAMAQRVFVGRADCEFNQQIDVRPLEGRPGWFQLTYKGAHYTLSPQETTTGAVRLQDAKAGIVWLQIPTKSMLMNHRIGQRMVDACTHAEQRLAGATGVRSASAR